MKPSKNFTAPERTFSRGRGCWNCIHFDNSDGVARYFSKRIHEDKQHLVLKQIESGNLDAAKGMTSAYRRLGELNPQKKQADARFQFFIHKARNHEIGICLGSGVRTDFVANTYYCDKWSGKTGHSIATEGHAVDKLPEELTEIVDAKAKNR